MREEVFSNIKSEYESLADELSIAYRYYIPISALDGDNVVNKSKNTPWFKEKPLLELLDTMDIDMKRKMKILDFQYNM